MINRIVFGTGAGLCDSHIPKEKNQCPWGERIVDFLVHPTVQGETCSRAGGIQRQPYQMKSGTCVSFSPNERR